MITVRIDGLTALRATIANQEQQLAFATARALTVTAHAVNSDIKAAMASGIAGGATPYALRAFKVLPATKSSLSAEVVLRTDAPSGGTPYAQALEHLFSGGSRRFKRLEGLLKSRSLMPASMQLAPAIGAPLDQRGNTRRSGLNEMLGILLSFRKNLQSFRRVGQSKQQKAVGFFVVLPGYPAEKHLHAGIYRRVTTPGETTSAIEPWFHYTRPGQYQQQFDLDDIATATVARVWSANFEASLAKALATAR